MKHCLVALILALTPVAASAEIAVPISPGLPGWEELTFDDLTPNRWSESDGSVLVESSGSVSVLYHRGLAVDLSATPILAWRWRVESAPPATDLFRKGGDDRAIAVGVGFAYDSANASFGERVKRTLVESIAGGNAPGRLISFVWGGSAPRGTVGESPYSGYSGRIVVQRPAGSAPGDWVEERVDLAELYRAQWGSDAPSVVSVDLSADSDDTGSQVRAQVTDIRFTAR